MTEPTGVPRTEVSFQVMQKVCTCSAATAAVVTFQLTAADYHLPTLGPKLRQLILNEVTNGKGLLVVK